MATNYLLGKAERLMTTIPPQGNKGDKWIPYGFARGKARLVDKLVAFVEELNNIPPEDCPRGEAVSVVTLHPSYLAKTYFPTALLAVNGLRSVGSRQREMIPEVPSPRAGGKKEIGLELFVAGTRESFRQLGSWTESITEKSRGADDIAKIEDIRVPDATLKIRVAAYNTKPKSWEAVLHASASPSDERIISSFATIVRKYGGRADVKRRTYVGGLCFMPVFGDLGLAKNVAPFAYLRVLRGMPRIREVNRTIGSKLTFDCNVPTVDAVDPSIRVAIFDGGPVDIPSLRSWVRNVEGGALGAPHDAFREHAIGVASAFLFGPIHEGQALDRPYANVDVVRVLDRRSAVEGPDYFDVLRRIDDYLATNAVDIVNLSIGPDWAVEDDEPHAWTAVLDRRFKEKQVLAFCAVGNNGEMNWESGNARVQPPSDCVNAIAVGSCNSMSKRWGRSRHSCIGPGRSPGVVKPELLAFGGESRNPYFVIGTAPGTAIPVIGTSYASPTAMRSAVGVRACLGGALGPLAIRALLINRATTMKAHKKRESGWGRVQHAVADLVTSNDMTVHIVYQRTIGPAEYLRAEIPMPDRELPGLVDIVATFVFAADTDPHHTINYTRAGLEVKFRPHSKQFGITTDKDGKKKRTKDPTTRPFFSLGAMYKSTEAEMRTDAHKWETVLHRQRRFKGSSLHDPVFDIHYNAREGGADPAEAEPIDFALVVTVHCKNDAQLYNNIVTRYRTKLEALTPIRLPIGLA
jgi:hypothetical protein